MTAGAAIVCVVIAVAGAGCSSDGHSLGKIDQVIGAACSNDQECAHKCVTDLPNGFCSIGCASNADCPADSFCAAMDGGVCLFACPAFDCTQLGNYTCGMVSDEAGGDVMVCVGA